MKKLHSTNPIHQSSIINQRARAQTEPLSITEVGMGKYPDELSNMGLCGYNPRMEQRLHRDQRPLSTYNLTDNPPQSLRQWSPMSGVNQTLLMDQDAALEYVKGLNTSVYICPTGKTSTGEDIVVVEFLDSQISQGRPADNIILMGISAETLIDRYLDTLDPNDLLTLDSFAENMTLTATQVGQRMYGILNGKTYLVDQGLVDQVIEETKDIKEFIPPAGYYQRPAVTRLTQLVHEHLEAKWEENHNTFKRLIQDTKAYPQIDSNGDITVVFPGKDVTVSVRSINPMAHKFNMLYEVTWVRDNPTLPHEAEYSSVYSANDFFKSVLLKIAELSK